MMQRSWNVGIGCDGCDRLAAQWGECSNVDSMFAAKLDQVTLEKKPLIF